MHGHLKSFSSLFFHLVFIFVVLFFGILKSLHHHNIIEEDTANAFEKSKNIEDPLEFYKYVLYLNAHYPDYYAKNYYGIIGHYNKLMTAAKTKRNRSHGETSRNNRELKRKGPSVSNDQPSVEKLNSKFSKKWVKQSDHSLITISTTPTLTTASDNTTPPITTLTSNTERESLSMFAVSPNGTSLVNDSRSSKHKIENKFVKRFSRSLNSTVSPGQEAFANASREIVNQDLFRAAIDEATTESIKTGSLDEIFAHLEDRFSNSETNKSEIDSSTVPETSKLPTTTITTDNTTAPTPLTTNNAVTTSVI